eukprot:scaffold9712_cov32-Tisochrysis_lutea.AAC.4
MVCVDGLWLGTWARFLAGSRLAPFVPTPPEVCRRLLQLGRLRAGERVVDLGCGDGRMLVTAVTEFGAASATGYELNSSLVRMAREHASTSASHRRAEPDGSIVVHEADALQAGADGSLAAADLVTLYLSTQGNAALLPMLRRTLRPGARVVSFHWEMPTEVSPSEVVKMPKTGVSLYLYEGVGLTQTSGRCTVPQR